MPTHALITVVETDAYLAKARKLLSTDERNDVVDLVANDPECGVLIKGTGGVRKVRIPLEGRGKSGGARVIYFFHDLDMPVYLLTVFPKNRKASLKASERDALAKLTRLLVTTYKERHHGNQ